MAMLNPFRPTYPIEPHLFSGREPEISFLNQLLLQTKSGNPSNFILSGDRGMGKTSLLMYTKHIAKGSIANDQNEKLSYLVVDVDISNATTQVDLVKNIIVGLWSSLGTESSARAYFQSCFSFFQYDDLDKILGSDNFRDNLDTTLLQQFSYSLTEFVNKLCSFDSESIFRHKYDGLLILIDEVDFCEDSLKFGSFIKHLLERAYSIGCPKIMVGLAGGLQLVDFLGKSHPSAPRLFNQIRVEPLMVEAVSRIIDKAIDEANTHNIRKVSITEKAKDLLITLSESRPYFVQQFGYSVFSANVDATIDENDVRNGIFGPYGALSMIGNSYFLEDYEKLADNERSILNTLAQNPTGSSGIDEIKEKFSIEIDDLEKVISELLRNEVIISAPENNHKYKIKSVGFSYWIKLFSPKLVVDQS